MNVDRSRVPFRPPVMTRPAFTVLELMISLALLGALLAVAWSILGSYRLSEQRGWDQAYRMQIVRTARELLESDASHWSGGVSNPAGVSSLGIGFDSDGSALVGDAEGFSVVMRPSIDPLPWLERVTATEPDASAAWAETVSGTASNSSRPLGIRESVRLSYRLFDEGESLASTLGGGNLGAGTGGSSVSSETGVGSSTGGTHLIRQLTPTASSSRLSASGSNASGSTGSDAIDADRELTVEDLYRVDESERVESATAIDTVWIRNLVNARFRYSDGAEWQDAWDGRFGGGLPVAIELSFDHPRASSPYAVEPGPAAGELIGSGAIGDNADASGSSDLDIGGRDVRIVVLVPGSSVRGSSLSDSTLSGSTGASP